MDRRGFVSGLIGAGTVAGLGTIPRGARAAPGAAGTIGRAPGDFGSEGRDQMVAWASRSRMSGT